MLRIETRDCTQAEVATGTADWFDEESVGCKFKDLRLAGRFRNLLEQVCGGVTTRAERRRPSTSIFVRQRQRLELLASWWEHPMAARSRD